MFELFGRKKRDGFFVEAGAHNGVEASNTLYFEKKMGWKGLLVEPNPDTFKGHKYTLAILLVFNNNIWSECSDTTPSTS